MESLVLNGKTYVRASKAARDLGYTADYVGQLCRTGQIDAHLVGRTWYVHAEELGVHRVEKKRMARVKAREQARKSIEEHRSKQVQKTNKNIDIIYETDPSDLIPAVRKISVDSGEIHAPKRKREIEHTEARREPQYEIENKGNKVTLSGTIVVEDASEDAIDAETTVMRPKFIHQRLHDTEDRSTEVGEMHTELNSGYEDATVTGDDDRMHTGGALGGEKHLTFMDRLEAEHVALPESEDQVQPGDGDQTYEDQENGEVTVDESVPVANTDTQSPLEAEIKTASWYPYGIALTLVLLIACGTLFLEHRSEYRHNSTDKTATVTTEFTVSVNTTIEKMRSKI